MTHFWVGVLALTIFLYVALDGFDLGIGMLFALDRNDITRRHMMAAIAPVWDGNETWLVLNATILFGAFPLTYSILFSAFYLPLITMLIALVFRGVAFEFRARSGRMRAFWDAGFIGGSFVAAFIQGATVGALVEGLQVTGHQYSGGPFSWLSAFAILSGFGLCAGYMLLGATWLTYKASADVQAFARSIQRKLLAAVLVFLAVAFAGAVALDLEVMKAWLTQPVLLAFPTLGALACVGIVVSLRRHYELMPFVCAVTIFAAAFGTLAVSFYPYMIPFSVTVRDAAAPPSSLAFLFWGAGVFVLPITLIYTLAVYFVFKGKVSIEEGHY
jgi:cytochrome d ubiquinol oxidase subunit II